MIKKIKKAGIELINNPFKVIGLLLNKMGHSRQCYVCKKRFHNFNNFDGGSKNVNIFLQKLNIVGSDMDNYGCPYCAANDRLRHLYMYFDKLNIWNKFKQSSILHFAPEKNLVPVIEHLDPNEYILADLFPSESKIQKVDITSIPFSDSTFDFVICNHVLEHIPDYKQAFSEIFRVLKSNGTAILQTPYSRLLKKNFEDAGINNDELRAFFYAQNDHARLYSEQQFFMDLENSGFELNIIKHSTLFSAEESYLYGVNDKEDLIMVKKTSSK